MRLKDHIIRDVVTNLRDVAIEFHAAGQLRERLRQAIEPLFTQGAAVPAEKIAPVQGYTRGIPWSLHMDAYDVYCKRYGKQEALIDLEGKGCRGGFSTGELDEWIPGWRDKVSEMGRLKARIAELERASAPAQAAAQVQSADVRPAEQARLGVGVQANDEGVTVAVHLGQGEHTTVLYTQTHSAKRDSLGVVTLTEHMSFNLGNAIKYLWRADEKGAPLDDLKKAAWYIAREIAKREATSAPTDEKADRAAASEQRVN